jgi:hypothetical protein
MNHISKDFTFHQSNLWQIHKKIGRQLVIVWTYYYWCNIYKPNSPGYYYNISSGYDNQFNIIINVVLQALYKICNSLFLLIPTIRSNKKE